MMMRFLLPAALAVVLLSASAQAAEYNEIGGGVSSSCGRWTEARSNQAKAFAYMYQQWVVGFLSGIGYAGVEFGADPLRGMDADGVWAWIDNYCRGHPIDTISAATKAFYSIHPH
jgi:opacity protein-like surface antigen